MTLSGMGWLAPFIIVSPVLLVLLITNGVNVGALFLRRLPLPWSLVLMLASVCVLFGLAVLILRLLTLPVRINAGAALIRAGRRTVPYADVVTAQLVVGASKKRRNLNLVLRGSRGPRIAILIRDVKGRTLTPQESALVTDLLTKSNIAMPQSTDDPSGRFARYNFPGHITKDDALNLVEHPPTFHDPLPSS